MESVRGVKRALSAAFVCCLLLPAASASASTHTQTMSVGPVTVGGYQVKYGFIPAPHPPVNGWVTHMDVDVVDGPGADAKPVPISRLMLHHIVFVNLSRRDGTCGSYTSFDSISKLPAAERFYAAGEERAKMALPSGYGYRRRQEPAAVAHGLRRPAPLHLAAAVGQSRPSFLPRASDPPRARADLDEWLQQPDGDPRRQGRAVAPGRELRRLARPHPRDGDHGGLHGARRVGPLGLRRPAERPGRPALDPTRPHRRASLPGADRRHQARGGAGHLEAARPSRPAGPPRPDHGR